MTEIWKAIIRNFILELREVAQAFNELADNLDQIEKKYAKPQESEVEDGNDV